MNRKIFFIGASLLVAVFVAWQLKLFISSRCQQSVDIPQTTTLPATETSTSTSETQKTITIQNNIEPSMLAYKHWSGTYKPSTFVITINGQELKPNMQQNVTITNHQLAIRFDYAFLNGKRKGSHVVHFKINTDKPLLNLSFSWKDKWQVILENATPYEVKKESFNKELA